MVLVRLLVLSVLYMNIAAKGILPCNQYTCSLEMVIFTKRQDNLCDLSCMSAACQFDSVDEETSNQMKENSGCLHSCLASSSQCRYEMLGNGKCDEGKF